MNSSIYATIGSMKIDDMLVSVTELMTRLQAEGSGPITTHQEYDQWCVQACGPIVAWGPSLEVALLSLWSALQIVNSRQSETGSDLDGLQVKEINEDPPTIASTRHSFRQSNTYDELDGTAG